MVLMVVMQAVWWFEFFVFCVSEFFFSVLVLFHSFDSVSWLLCADVRCWAVCLFLLVLDALGASPLKAL